MKTLLILFFGSTVMGTTVLNLAFTLAPEAMTRAVLHIFAA